MKRSATYISYAQSLLWIAILISVALGVSTIVELIFVDFVHENPHRTKANALFMMGFYPFVFAVITTIETFLVFTLPQLFQATVADVLVSRFGRGAQLGVLLALPLTAILAWYSYDYFAPPTDLDLGIRAGPYFIPFQHGLTMPHYLAMLAIQAPISLVSVLHWHATIHRSSKKTIIGAALVLAVLVGVILGYGMAQVQYQFL